MMEDIKFIDLFSGIGGFHIALESLGGECVFASEIEKNAIETYNKNFKMDSQHDITKADPSTLPFYNMMCAGFPCQTFSKAGNQKGFEEIRGTLFFDMIRLLRYRVDQNNPVKYIFFENVRNLISHDNHRTYKIIMENLHDLGYITNKDPIIVSPHDIGIPQLRDRAFILGIHKSYVKNIEEIDLEYKKRSPRNTTNCFTILDNNVKNNKNKISKYENYVLNAWDEFYCGIKEKTIGFPIWAEYFHRDEDYLKFPKWKIEIIQKNKNLYANNQEFIDKWLIKYDYLKSFIKTHRKFEWQCSEHCDSLWEGIIQFRPSGIRVKRPTEFPALVAMVHIPIVGKYKRRLTPREVANLQSFPSDFIINENIKQAYKQFGNSVNIEVVKILASKLISNADK